jgi:hypothetical protein
MSEPNVVVVGDFAYPAVVRRRGAKAPEDAWFRESAPFVVRAAADIDAAAPLAVTARDGQGREWRYRSAPSGLLRAGKAPETLASATADRSVAYWRDDRNAFPTGRVAARPAGHAANDRLLLRAAVIRSERDAALARATGLAALSLVAEGVVWHPAEQPVLAVRAGPRGTVTIDHVPAEDLGMGDTPFHVSDLAAALEHAAWMAAKGNPHPLGIVPPPHPAAIAIVPDRDAFLLLAARDVLSRIAQSNFPSDFARLPVPVMQSWLRFRVSAEDVEAGSVAAVAPAYAALGEMLDAVPADGARRFGNDETALDRIGYLLEGPVRHWRSYLAALAPEPDPEDDMRAIASLSR